MGGFEGRKEGGRKKGVKEPGRGERGEATGRKGAGGRRAAVSPGYPVKLRKPFLFQPSDLRHDVKHETASD